MHMHTVTIALLQVLTMSLYRFLPRLQVFANGSSPNTPIDMAMVASHHRFNLKDATSLLACGRQLGVVPS